MIPSTLGAVGAVFGAVSRLNIGQGAKLNLIGTVKLTFVGQNTRFENYAGPAGY